MHPKLFEDKNTLLPDLLDQFYFTQGNTLSYHYIQVRVNSMGWRVNHLSFSPFQEVSNSSNLTNVSMCFCLHYMQDSFIWINLEIPVENKVEQVFVYKFIDWLQVPVRHQLHACLAFQWNKQQIPFPLQEISSFGTKR